MLFMLLCTLCACASGRDQFPIGGPPDTTAPFVVATLPAPGSLNVPTDADVEVEFSEYLQEGNVGSAVTITPIPKFSPAYSWSGHSLEIAFAEPLVADRTYTITLGSSLSDNAGNRLGRPYALRFSTGATIDSGTIAGEVSGRSKVAAFAFAYRLPDDTSGLPSSFRLDSLDPDFIAPIGDDGRFSLEGLPGGRFRLIAVGDASLDRRYTPGEDTYGVPTRDVQLVSQDQPIAGVRIRLRGAPDDLLPPSLYSANSVDNQWTELRFSEPIDTSGLRPSNFTITAGGASHAVLDVWRNAANALAVGVRHDRLPLGESATVVVTNLADTAGNRVVDSNASALFVVAATADTTPPTLLSIGVDSLHPYTFPDSIRIAFNEPVRIADLAGAVAISDTNGMRIRFALEPRSPVEFLARPLDTLFGSARAWLEIDLRRFSDASGNRTDTSARLLVAIRPVRQHGAIEGSFTDTAKPMSLHVITLRERSTGRTYHIRNLRPGPWVLPSIPEGEYDVTLFRDDDGDSEYDYGSVHPWIPAETFVTWRGSVRVRPRWTTSKVDLAMP